MSASLIASLLAPSNRQSAELHLCEIEIELIGGAGLGPMTYESIPQTDNMRH